jgi:hypothetical protein
MKTLLALVILLLAAPVFAQQQPAAGPTLSPSVQQLMDQIHQVGCNAEAQAAATTIDNMQKQIDSLKAQLHDPPKSGATKR